MLLALLRGLYPDFQQTDFQLLGYTSVRAGAAMALAFLFSLLVGPYTIRRLTLLKLGQQVRNFKTEDTQQFNIHQHKAGTPTMGGMLIIGATLFGVLLVANLGNAYIWVAVLVMCGAGGLGFADDYLKVVRRDHKGLSARRKLLGQALIGGLLGMFLWLYPSTTRYEIDLGRADRPVEIAPESPESASRTVIEDNRRKRVVEGNDHLLVPFFKRIYPALGPAMLLWAILVIAGTSNAVNLTDGLDGLAIGCTAAVCIPYLVIAYLVSRFDYSAYLFIPHVPPAGELTVFLSALLGASLGFLWFNAHPAQMFMGDTGSLAIGAAIGAVALLVKHELLLVLIGGIFVVEALSVMLQVGSYKLRGKRVLLMSPLHNHFVKKNIDEEKIIARFLIVATFLALAGLGTLKLR